MFSQNIKSFAFLFFIGVFLSSCSKKEEQLDVEKKEKNVVIEEKAIENKTKQKNSLAASPSPDIMKPLAGTDPCFEAVELIRDEGDAKLYRGLGKTILLDDKDIVKDDHRTYIGIIGGMLRDKKSFPEIRQRLLDVCRSFKKEAVKK